MSSSAPACVVRWMDESDLTAVMAIERAAFSSPWTLATFTGLLGRESTRLWVAEAEGRVVGYAVVGRRRDYYSRPREDALVLRLSLPDRDLSIDSAPTPL